MYCKKCGKETDGWKRYCLECGKRKSLFRIFLIVAVVIILIPTIAYILNSDKERARRISCYSNLHSIGLSLLQYSLDYGFLPDKDGCEGLEQLRAEDYLTDYGIYTCPSTLTRSGDSGGLKESICDYAYIGGYKAGGSSMSGHLPVMFDKPGNHRNYFNVLYKNGSAEAFSDVRISNCKDIIIELNKKYKYDPAVLKKLMQKAETLDKLYGLK